MEDNDVYFVVSWDISASNPVWSQIDERMRNCFANYRSIRPVNTFYMVKVANGDQYRTIFNALQRTAQTTEENGTNIYFVMSPLFTVTGWDGWLQPDLWPKVAEVAS